MTAGSPVPDGERRDRIPIARRLRAAPLGILALVALMSMGALGSMTVGVYLLLHEGALTEWAGLVALLGGPAVLYLSYHLIEQARWAWLCLMVLVGLLFVSSVIRLLGSPETAVALGEIAVELALAVYLSRPAIRRRFGWGG